MLAAFVRGMAHVLHGRLGPGRRELGRAADLLESELALRDDPRFLPYAMLAAGWLGPGLDDPPVVERRLRVARERGARKILVPSLAMSSYARAWIGDHAAALAEAGEAVELAEQLHFVADAAPTWEMLAWQSAARGLHDDARHQLGRASALVERAGTTLAAALAARYATVNVGPRPATTRARATHIPGGPGRGTGRPGLSNREVAAALFLSPKTIEHHLTTVYPQAGVAVANGPRRRVREGGGRSRTGHGSSMS